MQQIDSGMAKPNETESTTGCSRRCCHCRSSLVPSDWIVHSICQECGGMPKYGSYARTNGVGLPQLSLVVQQIRTE